MAWNSIIFLVCFIYSSESLLLPLGWVTPKNGKKSLKMCIPTETSRGPCVVCVCNLDGVYICRSVKCTELDFTIETSECQSNVRYIKDHTVCTCSSNGLWLSENCRKFLKTLQTDLPIVHAHLRSNITCKPNSLYLIDCNVCKCDKNGLIQATSCTNRHCKTDNKADVCRFGDFLRTDNEICLCSDVNYYVDKLCRKINPNVIQEINSTVIKVVTDIGFKANKKCTAFREYYVDCNHCVCDESGKLICTKKDCTPKKDARKSENNLPSVRSLNEQCTPASYPEIHEGQSCVSGQLYKAGCNTCRCGRNNVLMCTKMACLDENFVKTLKKHHWRSNHTENKSIARNGLHGSLFKLSKSPTDPKSCKSPGKIEKKSCQICFCTNVNIQICTETCRDKILRETKSKIRKFPFKSEDVAKFPVLNSLSDKCEPGKMYRIDCNGCLCQESNNLICEENLCLSKNSLINIEAQKLSGKKCSQDKSFGCVRCNCVDRISVCKPMPKCDEVQKLSGHAEKVPLILNPAKEKCIPGTIYKIQCNQCYCQEDSTLRCTQKACLNYAQALKLEKQRLHLEKHGL